MNTVIAFILILFMGTYYETRMHRRFEEFRKHANERLQRLEDAVRTAGIKLPAISYGLFTSIDDWQ